MDMDQSEKEPDISFPEKNRWQLNVVTVAIMVSFS